MTLVLEGVGYRYAGTTRPALIDISVVVRPGEVIGLVGASESGKSTLCLLASGLAPRAIGGLIRGQITLDGEIVDSWPMHRITQHVGIGFQAPSTQLSGVADTVYEEVAFGPMNLGLPRAEVLHRTDAALDALRIADLASRDPWRLSGGQQQLVALAGLVALRPRYIVLDEPTAQLDPEGTRLVASALAELAQAGAGILIAEQKTDLLERLAGEVTVLVEGRVATSGTPTQVFGQERLAEWGVRAPAGVRLRHAAVSAGVGAPVEAALTDA